AQRALLERSVELELVVQLQTSDLREVVAVLVEEEVVEEGPRRLARRRIAGPETLVDLHDRLVRRADLVLQHRIAKPRPDQVHEQDLELGDAALLQVLEDVRRDLLIALDEDLARVGVRDVVRGHLTDDLLERDRELLDVRRFELTQRALRDL